MGLEKVPVPVMELTVDLQRFVMQETGHTGETVDSRARLDVRRARRMMTVTHLTFDRGAHAA
jgi:hypothetical protein